MIYKGGPEKKVSQIAKEATIGILNEADFFREVALHASLYDCVPRPRGPIAL
jgi:hypothetical protein